MRCFLKDAWMKLCFTLGIIVLAGQLGFAGAYVLKFLIGKQLALRLMLVCAAMVFVEMMEVRDRLF
jgi:hypothetical protein